MNITYVPPSQNHYLVVTMLQEDLTPESVVSLLEKLKKGEHVKVGPQTGTRRNCEGPNGKTSLFEPPTGPTATNPKLPAAATV